MWRVVVVLLAACSGDPSTPDLGPIAPHGCVRFGERAHPIEGGDELSDYVVGDFNGDGKPDLATTSDTIEIRLGRGDGSFAAPSASFGGPASWIAVGDLDRDGKLDLVVSGATSIVVYLGNGDGTFQPGVEHTGYGGVSAMALADVDGDGLLDIIVHSNTAISVGRGTGGGAFASPIVSPSALFGTALAVGDFDHDGKLDLAIGHGGGLSAIKGDGQGHFSTRTDVFTSSRVQAVDVADLDGDGASDLVFTDGSGVLVAFAQSGGTFAPAEREMSEGVIAVAARDVDHDGRVDLIVTGLARIDVMRQTGPRTFTALQTSWLPETGKIVTADLDGDGVLDVVTAGTAVLGRGDGTFPLDRRIEMPVIPALMATGDLDGDGIADVVVGGSPSTSAVLHGRGGGAFEVVWLSFGVRDLAVADIDQDGRADIVALSLDNLLEVLRGSSTDVLEASPAVGLGTRSSLVTVADVNGDGRLDLVEGEEHGVGVLLDTGDTMFRSEIMTSIGDNVVPVAAAVADIDRNGIADLLVATSDTMGVGHLEIRPGLGHGRFGAPRTLPGFVSQVIATDLDGDGVVDLVLVTDGNDVVMRGRGDGVFWSPHDLGMAGPVHVIDVDGDGHPDLIVLGLSAVQVALNNGNGTFAAPVTVMSGRQQNIAILDIDGDGAPDLLLGDGGELLNHSTQALCPP